MDRRNFFEMFAGLVAWAGFSNASSGGPAKIANIQHEYKAGDTWNAVQDTVYRNTDVKTKKVLFIGCTFDNCTFNGSCDGFPTTGPLAGGVYGCVFLNSPGYAIKF